MALFTNEEDPIEQRESIRSVYMYIGLLLTKYQSIEDILTGVFSRALMGSEARAKLLFDEARGLESKLKFISAAMVDWEDDIANAWNSIRPRVKACAEKRNQVAHSTPVSIGRGAVFTHDEKTGELQFAGYNEPRSQFELAKTTNSGEVVWDHAMLSTALSEAEILFRNLIGLTQRLEGERVTARLLEGWNHPSVAKWPTKK